MRLIKWEDQNESSEGEEEEDSDYEGGDEEMRWFMAMTWTLDLATGIACKYDEEEDEIIDEIELDLPEISDGDEISVRVDGQGMWFVHNGKPINKESIFNDPELMQPNIFPAVIFDSGARDEVTILPGRVYNPGPPVQTKP